MASLLDKLKGTQSEKVTARDSSGQLIKSGRGQLQQLTEGRDLPAPPSSPLMAQMMGLSSDSAKMVGTPAQKQSAIDIIAKPQETLATTQRTQQARTQQTQAEQIQYEKSDNLKQAGSIGDAIYNAVKSYLPQQAMQTPPQGQYKVNVKGLTTDPTILTQLEQLAQNPTPQAAAALAPLLAPLGITNPLDLIEVEGLGKSIAQQMQDSVTLEQLAQQPNSQIDLNTLSTELGIPLAQLNTMTAEQLSKEIDKVTQTEFKKTEDLRKIATDASVSASERQAAREQLRDLGATGVIAAEDQMDQLNQAIEASTQITIGGQSKTVEEFLSDSNLSQLALEYMAADTPEEKQKFTDTYGQDFTNFIETNRLALEDLADDLQTSKKQLSTIDETNRKLSDIPGVGTIADNVMKELIPEWGSLSSEEFDTPAIVDILKGNYLSAQQKQNLLNILNNGTYPISELKDKSLSELMSLGVLDNTPEFQNEATKKTVLSKLAEIDGSTPEGALAIANLMQSELGMTKDQAQEKLNQSRALGKTDDFTKLVDSNKDGIVDNFNTLKTSLETYLSTPEAKAKLADVASKFDSQDEILVKYANDFLKDGKFDKAEIDQIFDSQFLNGKAYEGDVTPESIKAHSDLISAIISKQPQLLTTKSDAIKSIMVDAPKSLLDQQLLSLPDSDLSQLTVKDITARYSSLANTLSNLYKTAKSPAQQKAVAELKNQFLNETYNSRTDIIQRQKEAFKNQLASKVHPKYNTGHHNPSIDVLSNLYGRKVQVFEVEKDPLYIYLKLKYSQDKYGGVYNTQNILVPMSSLFSDKEIKSFESLLSKDNIKHYQGYKV